MNIIKDSVVGFAVGDAMGVPIKHVTREKLLSKPVTKMIGHGTYDLESGCYADNTSLALATIDSISNCESLDYNDMAGKLCDWLLNGTYSSTEKAYGVDKVTLKALNKFNNNDIDAIKCGSKDFADISNGSLMRMLPIALYCHFNKLKNYEIYDIVKNTSSITHANDVCILGCYIYVNYMMFILNGKDKLASYNMLKLLDYNEFFDEDTIAYYNRILKANIADIRVDDLKSSSYIVNTLEAAIWIILNCDSFAESIVGAINLGDDTDSVGAITGSIAGAIYGYENIPDRWLQKLKKREYIESIADSFKQVIM